MPKIGPYDERELSDRLAQISLAEMQAFDTARRKKLRIYYLLALILGIASVPMLFLKLQILGLAAAVIGFILLSYGVYKRMVWIRLYQNLVYMKKQRESTLREAEKGRTQSRKFTDLEPKPKR